MMIRFKIYCTKDELDSMVEQLKKERFEIVDIEQLTFFNRLSYAANNNSSYICEPFVIKFNATKFRYNLFIVKNRLRKIFSKH